MEIDVGKLIFIKNKPENYVAQLFCQVHCNNRRFRKIDGRHGTHNTPLTPALNSEENLLSFPELRLSLIFGF